MFGDEQAPLNEDHKRRVTLVILLETFPGWTVEYAEKIIEERPMIVSDTFALRSARNKHNEQQNAKRSSMGW